MTMTVIVSLNGCLIACILYRSTQTRGVLFRTSDNVEEERERHRCGGGGGIPVCYLVVVSVVLGVLLLKQLPLPPLLVQGLLDQRSHLALLARPLSTNHKPALHKHIGPF